ncbi:MAG: DUF3786 domain-containing protein [Proteobacteria bacterium]|nr:DUF3786 domain-containing protein [Pseudomonadota bacterium]MBU4471693.1 DUF3786 domain-containing protein [Pseudomonadota bacterium]
MILMVAKMENRSRCLKGECNEKTCMAFAAAVFIGDKPLSQCPMVPIDMVANYDTQHRKINKIEQERDEALAALKNSIRKVNLQASAERTGGAYNDKKLTLKIMGKDFSVDSDGNLYTDIHVNPWVAMPILSYIRHCKGTPVSGQWTSMRELPGGKDWYQFFNHQCEKPLKKLADTYTDLFQDLVDIFNGQKTNNHDQADISVILHPLPRVPMMICYWRTEEGMESNLNLFFDLTAEENLGIEGLYSLGTGIVRMFEKLALRHGS